MRIAVPCVLLVVLPVLVACGPRATPAPAPARPTEATPSAGTTTGRALSLRVDHAWVKDAEDPATQAARRATLESLRSKVVAGASFVAAWNSLGVDGGPWHVAEGESYPADVLPAGARDLAAGQVSPVLPGDGGLHLFRVLAREPAS